MLPYGRVMVGSFGFYPSHSFEHVVGDGESNGVDHLYVAVEAVRCCMSEPQLFIVAIDDEYSIESVRQYEGPVALDRHTDAVIEGDVWFERSDRRSR